MTRKYFSDNARIFQLTIIFAYNFLSFAFIRSQLCWWNFFFFYSDRWNNRIFFKHFKWKIEYSLRWWRIFYCRKIYFRWFNLHWCWNAKKWNILVQKICKKNFFLQIFEKICIKTLVQKNIFQVHIGKAILKKYLGIGHKSIFEYQILNLLEERIPILVSVCCVCWMPENSSIWIFFGWKIDE